MTLANGTQWSAYFISYCVNQAVAAGNPTLTFPYAANHNLYAQAIRSGTYTWSTIDPRGKTLDTLRVGDIVMVLNPLSPTPYQNYDTTTWTGAGHADIVVEVNPGAKTARLIGGNLIRNHGGAVGVIPLSDAGNRNLNKSHAGVPSQPAVAILRPKDAKHGQAIASIAKTEFQRWQTNNWVNDTNPLAVDWIAKEYIAKSGVGGAGAAAASAARSAFGLANVPLRDSAPAPRSTITPYISSLDSFHPKIQQELLYRRFSSTHIDTYAPFVKLTSLLYVKKENLATSATPNESEGKDAWCPSLGVHDRQETSFEDIYSTQGQEKRSIVGYATRLIESTNDVKKYARVPVYVATGDATLDPPNVPPPGIVSVTTERSTVGPMGVRGGLFKANVKIVAYSIGQLNALMKYFMRPATRVVLEYGRLSGTDTPEGGTFSMDKFGYDDATILQNDPSFTRPSSKAHPNILYKYYDWNRSDTDILTDPDNGLMQFVTLSRGQSSFINNYIYYNYGNYEIFIGYVVKFTLKYGKNNTYEIDLTIHSVQQFEIPAKMTGAKPLCRTNNSVSDPCKVLDVHEYFSDDSTIKTNSFNYLLSRVLGDENSTISKEWVSHIIPIKTMNQGNEASGANNPQAATGIGGYYVSWKFFVNVILNDGQHGLMSIFRNNGTTNENYIRTNFLKPYGSRGVVPLANQNGLIAGEVAYNPSLRSTNPGVMIIYNAGAQQNSEQLIQRISILNEALQAIDPTYTAPPTSDSLIYNRIVNNKEVGSFGAGDGSGKNGETAFLHYGVWLNTSAIKDAFANADTVSAGINNLLNYMNSSVGGYWNLQLTSNDQENPGLHVIDALPKTTELQRQNSFELLPNDYFKTPDEIFGPSRENNNQIKSLDLFGQSIFYDINSSTGAGSERVEIVRPKYVYVFNSQTKELTNDDVGSEVLDVNITFDLPQAVAVQAIANIGGVAQRGTLNAIDIDELKSLSMVSSIYATCAGSRDDDVCAGDAPLPVTLETITNARFNNLVQKISETRDAPTSLYSREENKDKPFRVLTRSEIDAITRAVNVMSLNQLEQFARNLGEEYDFIEAERLELVRQLGEDPSVEAFDKQWGFYKNVIQQQQRIVSTRLGQLRTAADSAAAANPRSLPIERGFADERLISSRLQVEREYGSNLLAEPGLEEVGLEPGAPTGNEIFQRLIDENPNEVAAVREYGYLGQAIKLVELNPPGMVKKLDTNSTDVGNKVHPFNSSNLTKSIVDLTMPGIGGIQLFQTFAVARVPQLLQRGIYVVTKIAHEFTTQNGWITKIQGRFRYRPKDDE